MGNATRASIVDDEPDVGLATGRWRATALLPDRATAAYIRCMNPRLAVSALALGLSGCVMHRSASLPASIPPAPGEMRTAFALRQIDVAQGTGALAEPRKCFYAHYTGWLLDGKKFDSSRDTAANGRPGRRSPFLRGRVA